MSLNTLVSVAACVDNSLLGMETESSLTRKLGIFVLTLNSQQSIALVRVLGGRSWVLGPGSWGGVRTPGGGGGSPAAAPQEAAGCSLGAIAAPRGSVGNCRRSAYSRPLGGGGATLPSLCSAKKSTEVGPGRFKHWSWTRVTEACNCSAPHTMQRAGVTLLPGVVLGNGGICDIPPPRPPPCTPSTGPPSGGLKAKGIWGRGRMKSAWNLWISDLGN